MEGMSGYDRCKVCGQVFNCECEFVMVADLRKLVEEMRNTRNGGDWFYSASCYWADKLEQLLKREGE